MNTRHAVIDSPLGELTLVADGDALIGLYFRHHWYRPSADTFGPRVDAETTPCWPRHRTQLDDYPGRRPDRIRSADRARGDDLQRRVWDRLTDIPYGETVTYGELAAELADGSPPRRSARPSAAIRCRSSFRVTGWSGRTAS